MTKERKIQALLLAIALIISCFLTCFTSTIGSVYASTIDVVGGYTNVLHDLQTDPNFDANDYPVKGDDYSLIVIQLAESSDKQVFIYVYQPSADYKSLVASSVFLSTAEKGLSYTNYYLTLLNKQGVFYKYRVDNFFVSNETTRHYEITSIYRPFDESIDEKLDDDNENIINEVNYKVGKHWIFTTTETGVEIVSQDIETITITDKYVGFCRYEDGYTPGTLIPGVYSPGIDSHFVAFKTDKQIDKLLEADVYYTSQYYHYRNPSVGSSSTEWGSMQDKYSYLTYTQKVSYEPGGVQWGKYVYEWDRIQSVDEFIASESREYMFSCGVFNVRTKTKLTDEGLKDVQDMDWVLRFTETEWGEYQTQAGTGAVVTRTDHEERTIVGNVSILRLKFETDGVTYNLGVIDNKQTGDGNPDNYTKTTFELSDIFKYILMILLLVLLLIILASLLPTIFNIVVWLLKIIIKVVWWIICLPFKLIKALYKKRE